ncbi:PucR family transcriptional regulator [Pseudonocardia sp. HH130630-07]|uniref:PucR family transcriptional regulator n=1 Tax=Pseudonocardia sp. HH130630-07 TaxID=1690815 RepID=UPI000815315A|nr:helix-turn-helix domain-containing protein [Pseudonocardia sp. HH130630-07]ANY09393.1 CdaR family transcriptional regulator [Pseudonocardia sp. HH130630-07]
MSHDELQSIVDALAERLRRSVAVDDPALRLLAASRHFGDEDDLRVRSVLDRAVQPAVAERVLAAGVAGWAEPGVVAVEGAAARLCAPVRCNGMLLGYLWLIDAGGAFADADTAAAGEAATAVGTVLYRSLLLHERSTARREAILRELVSPDGALRARATEDLYAEQLLGDDSLRFTVLVVHFRRSGTCATQRVAFEAALEEGVRAVTDDLALTVANRSWAWMLLIGRSAPSGTLLGAVRSRITDRFRRLVGGDASPVFGIGGTVEEPGAVASSYRQALLAGQVAMLPGSDGLARWGGLGPFGLLLRLPPEDVLDPAVVPALAALDEQDPQRVLAATLTEFLDRGGSVRRTADALCVHRATLHQRLRRIEQITGCDLDSGDDRLMLHLGLKLRLIATVAREQFDGS